MACTPTILGNLANPTSFYTFISGQQSLADASTTIASLAPIQTTLQNYRDCLIAENSSVTSANTDNSTLRNQIIDLHKTLKERKLDVQISQDRALLVRHPEMSRSYYDGILPIGRPIKHYTVPILIGISTFLLSLSFFMLLNIFRFDARLIMLVPAYMQASNGFSLPFWIMSGIVVILLGLTIYAFTK
jgi:hypothetical protein